MADKFAYKPGFADNDLQLDPYDRQPEISEDVQQGISYLLGWHNQSESWKSVLVDTDGRVLVSSSPTQSNVATNAQATVGTASGVILAANDERKQYIIENVGTVTAYIGFGSAAIVASGFALPAGAVFSDDVFTGVVNAIVAAGSTDLRIVGM